MRWLDFIRPQKLTPGLIAPQRLPVLKNSRVLLRVARPEDWAEWASLREKSYSFLKPWEPTWAASALDEIPFQRRLLRQEEDRKAGTAHAFLIFDSQNNQMVGGLNLTNIRRSVVQSGTVGYWIGAPFIRQGYMSAALSLLIRFSFEKIGLHRLEAACLPRNTASRALLQKVGFQEEGLARGYLMINEAWEDHLLFGLLRDDPHQSAG